MRYAIAIWNYAWAAEQLPGWIRAFADRGFDTMSLNAGQFGDSSACHLPAVVDVLRDRDLGATVHGACAMDRRTVAALVKTLGDRLHAITLDSATRDDSRGRFHDARRIADALAYLQSLTAGTDVRLAIEDFPLDALALEHFTGELGSLYEHPRTGILVDVGHMNIRMRTSEYFQRLSVAEYFRALPCRLVEVHLHDNNGEKDQHGPFGFGNVPFADVARALREIRFDGVSTIEIAPSFHGSTPQESRGKAVESLDLWRTLIQPDSNGGNRAPNGIRPPGDASTQPPAGTPGDARVTPPSPHSRETSP